MIIKTYKEYNEYIKAFTNGYFNFLIIKSSGGHGKTYAFEQEQKQGRNIIILSGHVTPLSFYRCMYKNPKGIIVLDDVNTTFRSVVMGELLKQATDSKPQRFVRYSSTSPLMKTEKLPDEFEFKGQIAILTNEDMRNNNNQNALLTRALYLEFLPSNKAVFEIMNNFEDKELLSFLELFLDEPISINFRDYNNTKKIKDSGLDWKHYFINSKGVNNDEYELTLSLEKYKQGLIDKATLKTSFLNLMAKSERSFYNWYNENTQ